MNAIVFAPRTSPEIAARQLCAVMLSRGDTPMPDPAALADALTRAACRAAENLIDNAAASMPIARAPPPSNVRRPRALIADARTTPARATVAHPARTPQRRASPCPRTWRARPSLDVVARLDPRYRLRDVPRTRTRRHLLGRDRLSWFPVRLRLRSVWRRKVTCRRTLRVETLSTLICKADGRPDRILLARL